MNVHNWLRSCLLNSVIAPVAASVAMFALPPSLAWTMASASGTGVPDATMSDSIAKPISLSAAPDSRCA